MRSFKYAIENKELDINLMNTVKFFCFIDFIDIKRLRLEKDSSQQEAAGIAIH